MRNWLRNKGIPGKYAAEAAHQLIEIFPSDEHGNQILWHKYLSHGLKSSHCQNKARGREISAF
jgi:hypothetical protein